jgi:uncharacterized membrane protein YeaQ/YmgE (transglycosylase-associated protein family)
MNGHGIIMTIVVGLVIGLLARLFKPGADPLGWILTILLGIAGAWIGGMLVPAGGALWWVASIVAAIVLLVIFELIRSRTARPRV